MVSQGRARREGKRRESRAETGEHRARPHLTSSRPGTCFPARRAVKAGRSGILSILPYVLCHPLLERLELLVELVGRHLLARLGFAHEPRRRFDRRAPGGLVGIGLPRFALVPGGVRRGLHLVQVDVGVLPALVLVVLDAHPLALEALGLLADSLTKRGVLVAAGVLDDIADVAAACL